MDSFSTSFIRKIINPKIIRCQNIIIKKHLLQNIFFVSSLRGRSLHLVKFDRNYERVIFSEKIYLNRIIRDLKYIDEYNLFILSLGRKNSGGERHNADGPSQLGIITSKI